MRKPYQPSGKISGSALTHMRDVAFGPAACLAVYRAGERSARMRNDQGLLDAAQAKREMKAKKRVANHG